MSQITITVDSTPRTVDDGTTGSELYPDRRDVVVARVNGEERSRGMSGTMHHKFEDILAHVSKDETVYPGEFFGSGTVGNGSGMEFGRFLKAGDVIELEIDGLGVLRNRVVASQPVTP